MKKRILEIIVEHYVISSILVLILGMALGTLIFWGLGNLAIEILNINYEWTIWHGLLAELFYIIIKDMVDKI